QHFASVVQRSPMGMYIMQDGSFAFANPEFLRQTGYTTEELIGQPASILAFPEDKDGIHLHDPATSNGGPSAREVRCRVKDGSARWFASTCSTEGARLLWAPWLTTPNGGRAVNSSRRSCNARRWARTSAKAEFFGL
ncbi:MAG: PAS domain S-box protein, partial [SAR202 cluster bacterium]|nr:PAS domain S-box protein [SAR202 cluster bacterium]